MVEECNIILVDYIFKQIKSSSKTDNVSVRYEHIVLLLFMPMLLHSHTL